MRISEKNLKSFKIAEFTNQVEPIKRNDLL